MVYIFIFKYLVSDHSPPTLRHKRTGYLEFFFLRGMFCPFSLRWPPFPYWFIGALVYKKYQFLVNGFKYFSNGAYAYFQTLNFLHSQNY